MADFLPIATDTPVSNIPAATNAANAIDSLAEVLSTDDTQPTSVRFGAVTSISDPNSAGRVQLDIADTAWCSKAADLSLAVGDRIVAVQQGPVLVVIGRLSGGEAQPIGSMLAFAGSTAPTGWLLCNGASVLRATYPALFAVIGTTYGSVDGTHFTLPSLTNRVPVGSGGTYSRGGTGGASTVTLTSAQLASHSHGLSGVSAGSAGSHSHGGSTDSAGSHSHSEGTAGTRSDILAGGGTTVGTQSSGTTGSAGSHSHGVSTDSQGSHSHSISGSSDSAGSGSAHENMPPYLAVPWIIRAL